MVRLLTQTSHEIRLILANQSSQKLFLHVPQWFLGNYSMETQTKIFLQQKLLPSIQNSFNQPGEPIMKWIREIPTVAGTYWFKDAEGEISISNVKLTLFHYVIVETPGLFLRKL